MVVYFVLVILSVFFTWLQQVGAIKNGLKISYFLTFLFLALRHDYGNDYASYWGGFLSLQSFDDESFYYRGNEVGWQYLNYAFKFLFGNVGFHLMLASMAAFTCFVLYRFTIKYISPKYYTFAIALLLLEPNNILVLSSAMRQSIAVAIFLLSFDYLLHRRYFLYTAGILLASLFHTSVLVYIVLILLNFVNWKIYLPYVMLVIFAFLGALSNLNALFGNLNMFLESQESEYLIYTQQGQEESTFGLGFVLSFFLYFLIIVVNRKAKRFDQNTITKVAIVGVFFLILGLSVNMASRLNFYIFPWIVCGYVIALTSLADLKSKLAIFSSKLLALIIVLFFVYQNYLFWQSEVYAPHFLEYKTVFQSPLFE